MTNRTFATLALLVAGWASGLAAQAPGPDIQLPNGRLLGEVPGKPRPTNHLATAAAVAPDGRFAVFLHSGYGSETGTRRRENFQSLSVLNLETDSLADFPDARLGPDAHQTYFLGLAFSLDGSRLYASMASLTDPLGKKPG